MKKLFGSKPRPARGTVPSTHPVQEEHIIPTPIHQQHAVYQYPHSQPPHNPGLPARAIPRTSSEEERWEVVSGYDDAHLRNQYQVPASPSHNSSFASLPAGASPPIPSPNGARSPSPFSINSNQAPHARDREQTQSQQQQVLRKKQPTAAPVALRILGALDPPTAQLQARGNSEERFMNATNSYSDSGHREREKDPPERKEKRGFWSRGDKDKDKDKDKDREKDKERDARERGRMLESRDSAREKERREHDGAELTRMIGFLTATASEDWGLVMEVCERASANESNAKEAVRALRREFKYGEPAAQLSAARLWAIMLRNSSELFISQSTARKFLDTLEDLINSSRTSPVVRERVLDVIAAAAYASGSKRDTGFRGLWKRVKPHDKPDEGMPLDNDDAMFNPPVSSRTSHYESSIPGIEYQEPSPLQGDYAPATPQPHPPRKHESRNRIIPPDEDIRRLFQECKIGQGNASLLSQALALSKPEDLKKKDVIKEFYVKCRASQELIFAQIPWASAGAEQSRAQRDQEALVNGLSEDQRAELTTKEKLLAALLSANAELIDALQQYDDLERVAMERMAEEVSRKETRMDRRQWQQYQQDGEFLSDSSLAAGRAAGSSSPSRSRSPSPEPAPQPRHPHTHTGSEIGSLAPPPPAPNGPRSPAQINTHAYTHSRTPSPATPVLDNVVPSGVNGFEIQNGMAHLRVRHDAPVSVSSRSSTYDEYTPIKPSAKALGKRKAAEEDLVENFGEEDFYGDGDVTFSRDHRSDSDDDRSTHEGWPGHRPIQYVYDAVAERTQQRIREEQALVVNGVH
ncbi:putative VHS domain containing protein [Lyophyllum shimeji]|uniref:VHS domain containing protein n=1 Tax=Lyophyllum shimeji TaxID=47721 RepID=A0A9P3Q0T9_LYOSH|nr:putative VHS domain containing protein [Lyophyllum shimeji]